MSAAELVMCAGSVLVLSPFAAYVWRELSAGRSQPDWRGDCVREVSKVMDEAPEWRDWFAYQLELLDLEYDPNWWMTVEMIR